MFEFRTLGLTIPCWIASDLWFILKTGVCLVPDPSSGHYKQSDDFYYLSQLTIQRCSRKAGRSSEYVITNAMVRFRTFDGTQSAAMPQAKNEGLSKQKPLIDW